MYINTKLGTAPAVETPVLPKVIYRFSTVHIRTLAGSFAETDKLVLKLIWKGKGPRIAKAVT